jgi:hypothetical protein
MLKLGRPVAEVQEEVILLLKREVVLMREILSSLYEEEKALLEKNPKALQEVMLERDQPLQDLKDIREEISQKMRDLLFSLKFKTHLNDSISLIGFLEKNGFETCEIMILADQIVALIEKMNKQTLSIDHLMIESSIHWKELMQGAFVHDVHHPSSFRAYEEKKKGVMLTVQSQDENIEES